MSGRTRVRRVIPLAIAVAIHLAVTVWLAAWYRRSPAPMFTFPVGLLAVSSLPVAQATLFALWAVRGRVAACLRLPAAVLLVTVIWYVECRALAFEVQDYRCAAHALMLTTQVLIVGLALGLARALGWFFTRIRQVKHEESRLQFGLGAILTWFAGLGLVLGAWKWILVQSQWTFEDFQGDLIPVGGVIGAFNAVIGLLMIVAVLWGRRWWRIVLQVLIVLVVIAASTWYQQDILGVLFDGVGNMQRAAWMIQGAFQSLILLTTLVLIRLSAYNSGSAANLATSSNGDLP